MPTVSEEANISTRAGPAGIKTKGAVAVCFTFFGTSFLFINAHLTRKYEYICKHGLSINLCRQMLFIGQVLIFCMLVEVLGIYFTGLHSWHVGDILYVASNNNLTDAFKKFDYELIENILDHSLTE